ncbi:MAG: DUF6364 family protein [Flavobacteriia bacterium]|jgi:hypothetical protein
MQTKLTLTIEQDIIKSAKSYAQDKGRSLSEIIENYLKALVSNAKTNEENEKELSPRVKRLIGVVDLPTDFDYKKTLSEEINKKHNS